MPGSRRFSQAISEGDGISVLVEVHDVVGARAATQHGAEALLVRGALAGLREATELPLLWCAEGSLQDAVAAGADAFLFVDDDPDRLSALHAEALELGLDCVVEVRDEEELERALEHVDPEIFLLSAAGVDEVLDLLPDVPAGKLAIAGASIAGRAELAELERAGVDAVIVRASALAELVGETLPPV